jgi:hypothetical protein
MLARFGFGGGRPADDLELLERDLDRTVAWLKTLVFTGLVAIGVWALARARLGGNLRPVRGRGPVRRRRGGGGLPLRRAPLRAAGRRALIGGAARHRHQSRRRLRLAHEAAPGCDAHPARQHSAIRLECCRRSGAGGRARAPGRDRRGPGRLTASGFLGFYLITQIYLTLAFKRANDFLARPPAADRLRALAERLRTALAEPQALRVAEPELRSELRRLERELGRKEARERLRALLGDAAARPEVEALLEETGAPGGEGWQPSGGEAQKPTGG